MKRNLHCQITSIISLFAICLGIITTTGCKQSSPKADHVILIGLDAMSSLGLQRAETPNFNRMIDNGAVSLDTRCIRATSSSQNWMSMVSAAPSEMHSVLGNRWKREGRHDIEPAIVNKEGIFPTIFDFIREQRPEIRQYAYIEWQDEIRMYDTTSFDVIKVHGLCPEIKGYKDVIDLAFKEYLQDRPEFMFLSMDITDGMGHGYGHESDKYLGSITEMDSIIGTFVDELEARGWMKNTVIIITSDHGGLGFGHGGDTMAELEIPVIIYGKGVTKGKVMKGVNMIYDIGATVAGLFGVELPWECRGKFLKEAFEPSDGSTYAPVPFVRPFTGRATDHVTITADAPQTKIYYTLDGSEPNENSTLYEGPFSLENAAHIRSASYRNGCRSEIADNYLNPAGFQSPISYKLYKGVYDMQFGMPDFTKFGKATATGYSDNFSLAELGLETEKNFAILFTTTLVVDKKSNYRFELVSCDGGVLVIDGKTIIDRSTAMSKNAAFGSVQLDPGRYALKLGYYNINDSPKLSLRVSINDEAFRPLIGIDLDR